MSGAPGVDANNPEGFVTLTNPALTRTIAVDQISGAADIPLSVFPNFRSDGGIRGYGGAKIISVFDINANEGVSTPDIPAINEQSLDTTGTFQVVNPDAQKLYGMVIRLRSAVGDPNFRDFTVYFRIVGPLEVPLVFAVYPDLAIPTLQYDGVDFTWDIAAPTAEIRIRDAAGGIQVTSAAATPFNAAAKSFLLNQLNLKRNGGIIVVDFYADGVDATRRQYYHYEFDGASWVFTKFRHRDYPNFDTYSGSDLGIAEATIDIGGGLAELTFTNNSHTFGQKFESLIVMGKEGYLSIDPKLVITGGVINISAVVDFATLNALSKFHIDDQFVTLYGATESQIIVRHIPMFVSATQTMSIAGDEIVPSTLPTPIEILRARLLLWPWIEFPNLSDFLNIPPGLIGADPAGGTYPDIRNIQLFDGPNPVSVATYVDEVDLWNNMVEVQLPNQGLTVPVLDVRALLTVTSTHFRMTYDVRTAVSAPGNAYSVEARFPLNGNGEPVLYTRSDLTVLPYNVTFEFLEYGKLGITYLNTDGVLASNITVTGDVGTAVVGTNPSAVQTDTHDISALMSRQAAFVDVELTYNTGGGDLTTVIRVPTTVQRTQLIGAVDISPIISGSMIVFPTNSLALVDGPQKEVTLIGDVGTIVIEDAQENQPYILSQFGDGGERLLSNPLVSFIDIEFLAGAVQQRVRVPNSFWDLRETYKETLGMPSRGHGPTAGGLAGLTHEFSLPKVKVSLTTSEVEFEDDLTGLAFNFQQWQVLSLEGGLKRRTFSGTILPATPYNIGDVLVNAKLNSYVLMVFKHATGHQRVFAVKITNTTFEEPKRMQLDGYI